MFLPWSDGTFFQIFRSNICPEYMHKNYFLRIILVECNNTIFGSNWYRTNQLCHKWSMIQKIKFIINQNISRKKQYFEQDKNIHNYKCKIWICIIILITFLCWSTGIKQDKTWDYNFLIAAVFLRYREIETAPQIPNTWFLHLQYEERIDLLKTLLHSIFVINMNHYLHKKVNSFSSLQS